MHEAFIINKIIEEAEKFGKVKKIKIELGELANITKEDLEEHLKEVVDWDIKINIKKSKIECNCGYKGKPNILERGHDFCLFNCPKCKGKVKVLKGGEIKIKEVK